MQRNNLEFYDQQAPSWWNEAATIYPLSRLNPLRFAYFDRLIPHWKGLAVLDVGCGGGYTCEFLAQRQAQVWGIDRSGACIDAARRHAQAAPLPITYAQGVAEALPFADATFDVVVCVDVLEHVEDLPRAIAEISRVLKPGGYFCFDTVNRTWQSQIIMIWLLENILRKIPRGIHDWRKFITPSELTHLMSAHGLGEATICGFNLFGSTLRERIASYRYYQKTGNFRVRFDDDTRIMYIGLARKEERREEGGERREEGGKKGVPPCTHF